MSINADQTGTPRDILLVHGAWHGGWCWEPVRALLEAGGHRVFSPTLSGLAERANELSPGIGLETHIEDVLEVIAANDLSDVVVCGHSYGGMVITGVADRMKHRIAHIVYLDAALPLHGETMLSYGEPRPGAAIESGQAAMRAMAPDGVGMAVLPPSAFGIGQSHPLHEWVANRLTPHPLKTWLDRVSLVNDGSDGLHRTYVLCTDPVMPHTQFAWVAAQAKDDPTWHYAELATGHDAMITDPVGVAEVLAHAARFDNNMAPHCEAAT